MRIFLKLFAFYYLLIAYSCSEPSLVGEELLQESTLYNALVSDTFAVKLTTVKADTLSTANIGNYMLGYIEDKPDFGTSKASIFTQVRLPFNNIDFTTDTGEQPIYDSLVLQLGYNFAYGDSSSIQTFKVHELAERMIFEEGNVADQYDSFEYNDAEAGALYAYKHNFKDSVITIKRPIAIAENGDTMVYEEDNITPRLSIKLNDDLGERLFSYSGQNPFIDNDEFLKTFYGFYIDVDENASEQRLMVSYNLQSSSISSLVLHYHTESEGYIYGDTIDGMVDSLKATNYTHYSLAFPINFNALAHNRIINDYGGTQAEAALNNQDAAGNNLAYMHGMGGLNIKVEFPDLTNGKLDKAIINSANLILKQIPSNNGQFPPTTSIGFYSKDADGNFGLAKEYGSSANLDSPFNSNTYNIGGNLNEDGNHYSYNIAGTVQDIIEQDNTNEIILIPSSSLFNASRTKIGGNINGDFQAKIQLIYTLTE